MLNHITKPPNKNDSSNTVDISIDKRAWEEIFRVMKENSYGQYQCTQKQTLKIHEEGSAFEGRYEITHVIHSSSTKDHNWR